MFHVARYTSNCSQNFILQNTEQKFKNKLFFLILLTSLVYIPNNNDSAQISQPKREKSAQSTATPCHEGDLAIYILHLIPLRDEKYDNTFQDRDDA